MLRAIFKSSKYVNVEIKDYVIRFAEVKNKRPVVVQQCGEHYLPKGIIENGRILNKELFQTVLRRFFQKWNLKEKPVRFIVPDSAIVIRKINVPADVPDDEINGYLYFELDHTIHLPFEHPVIDHAIIGKKEDSKEVLLIASPEEIVNSYADILKEQKTRPVAADISPLCQYRLFDHLGLTEDDESILLIQTDTETATISIFEKHTPIFMQQFVISYPNAGWDPVINSESGTISFDRCDKEQSILAFQDLYLEVERILRFYQYSLHNGGKEITQFFLTGDHPFFQDIVEQIGSRFSIRVSTIPIHFLHNLHNEPVEPKYFAVLGLGIREGE